MSFSYLWLKNLFIFVVFVYFSIYVYNLFAPLTSCCKGVRVCQVKASSSHMLELFDGSISLEGFTYTLLPIIFINDNKFAAATIKVIWFT